MSYIKKLINCIGTICFAIVGILLCILYALGWLLVLLIFLPLLCICAIPLLIIALCASFCVINKKLDMIDEDI